MQINTPATFKARVLAILGNLQGDVKQMADDIQSMATDMTYITDCVETGQVIQWGQKHR